MIPTQALRVDQLVYPSLKNNASFTSQTVDLASVHDVFVVFQLGTTDVALTALKLTECDTPGGSYTDIPGSDYSASGNTLPTSTDDNKYWGWYVPRHGGRKRYMQIVATAAGTTGTTGCLAACTVIEGSLEIQPVSAATAGVAQLLTCIS